MNKKMFAILIITIILAMLSSCSNTAKANPASDFEYRIGQNEITITGYKGNITDVVIPEKIEGKPVTKIGTSFKGIDWITSVVIPEGVTDIDEEAFHKCSSLTNVTIPDSVTSIGGYAFYECIALTNITIPKNVTNINGGTFESCHSLTSVVIPEGLTNIDYWAFAYCNSLTDITIPDSITIIGANAFTGCDLLPDNVINKIVQINPDAIA